MTVHWRLILSLGLVLPAWNPAAAQGPAWRGEGEWGPRGQYQRLYDPNAVETIRGRVVSLDTFLLRPHGRAGLHLHVLRAKDTLIVHLGPLWYIENQDMTLAVGDTVTVKGAQADFHGSPVLIAAEVTKGGETFTLRDARGFPAWSAGRRKTSSAPRARGPG